jgi:hypothetical protein
MSFSASASAPASSQSVRFPDERAKKQPTLSESAATGATDDGLHNKLQVRITYAPLSALPSVCRVCLGSERVSLPATPCHHLQIALLAGYVLVRWVSSWWSSRNKDKPSA